MVPSQSFNRPDVDRRLLAAIAVAPFALFAVVWYLGMTSLLRLGVIGAVGLFVLAFVFTRPRLGVYFLVFWVYSGVTFYLPGVVAMAVMAATAVAAFLRILGGDEVDVDAMFVLTAGLFVLFALNSFLVAYSYERALGAALRFAKTLALVGLSVYFIRSISDLRRFALTIFLGAIATIVLGAINLKMGIYVSGNVIGGVEIYRFSGTHPDPNGAAGLMCSAVPLGVFFVRHAKATWQRWLAAAGVLILVAGLFSTFSRAAIVAFSMVTVLVVSREVRSRGGWILVAGFVALAILITPGYYWERLFELQQALSSNFRQDFSVTMRYDAFRAAWKLFLEHPWIGIGVNNFVVRGAFGVVQRIVVHNAYVEVLVSVGILGFMAYLGMLMSGIRQCVAGALRARSRELRSLSFYMGLSLFSIMATALFLSIHFDFGLWIPVAGGLVVGGIRRRDQSSPA